MNKDIIILREVIGKLTQMLAGMGLRVTQQGSMAYVETDPKTLKPARVNIPYLPDNASEGLILAIQGFIDHEVAHILFTQWETVQKAYKKHKELGVLHNIVEDTFIERAIGGKFPGAVHNLDKLHEFFLKHITAPAVAKAKTPMEQFSVLLVPVCRAWSGQEAFKRFLDENKYWDSPLIKAFIDKVKPDTIKRMPKIADSWQSLEIAEEFFDIIHPMVESEAESDGDGEEDGKPGKPGEKSSGKATKSGKGGEGGETGEAEKSESAGESDDDAETGDEGKSDKDETDADAEGAGKTAEAKKETKGSGSEESEEEFDPNDPGKDTNPERFDENSEGETETEPNEGDGESDATGRGSESTAGGSPFSGEKPELSSFEDALTMMITDETTRQTRDADYVVFTKDFDVIQTHEVSPYYKDTWLSKLDDKTRHMVGVMQKDVERMMAQRTQVVHVPGFKSGRLHSAGLHRLTVNDPRVFRRKQEAHATDTAVCLLVDNSGSMNGSKTEVAMSAAFALSSTLERVKVAHECIGFTTRSGGSGYNYNVIREEEKRLKRNFSRTEAVYMPIYKGFDERLVPNVKKRFADVVGCQNFLANNIDGEAVETATLRLMKRKEKRKVLIVLSDGFPACAGNPGEIYSHLHKAIADATKLGVQVIGIGIQSNAVKTFYPHHVVLEDLDKLPSTVMGQIKQILMAA